MMNTLALLTALILLPEILNASDNGEIRLPESFPANASDDKRSGEAKIKRQVENLAEIRGDVFTRKGHRKLKTEDREKEAGGARLEFQSHAEEFPLALTDAVTITTIDDKWILLGIKGQKSIKGSSISSWKEHLEGERKLLPESIARNHSNSLFEKVRAGKASSRYPQHHSFQSTPSPGLTEYEGKTKKVLDFIRMGNNPPGTTILHNDVRRWRRVLIGKVSELIRVDLQLMIGRMDKLELMESYQEFGQISTANREPYTTFKNKELQLLKHSTQGSDGDQSEELLLATETTNGIRTQNHTITVNHNSRSMDTWMPEPASFDWSSRDDNRGGDKQPDKRGKSIRNRRTKRQTKERANGRQIREIREKDKERVAEEAGWYDRLPPDLKALVKASDEAKKSLLRDFISQKQDKSSSESALANAITAERKLLMEILLKQPSYEEARVIFSNYELLRVSTLPKVISADSEFRTYINTSPEYGKFMDVVSPIQRKGILDLDYNAAKFFYLNDILKKANRSPRPPSAMPTKYSASKAAAPSGASGAATMPADDSLVREKSTKMADLRSKIPGPVQRSVAETDEAELKLVKSYAKDGKASQNLIDEYRAALEKERQQLKDAVVEALKQGGMKKRQARGLISGEDYGDVLIEKRSAEVKGQMEIEEAAQSPRTSANIPEQPERTASEFLQDERLTRRLSIAAIAIIAIVYIVITLLIVNGRKIAIVCRRKKNESNRT